MSERGESAVELNAGNAASTGGDCGGLAAVGAVCKRVPCLRQAAVSPAEAALRPQSPPLRLPFRMNSKIGVSRTARGKLRDSRYMAEPAAEFVAAF